VLPAASVRKQKVIKSSWVSSYMHYNKSSRNLGYTKTNMQVGNSLVLRIYKSYNNLNYEK